MIKGLPTLQLLLPWLFFSESPMVKQSMQQRPKRLWLNPANFQKEKSWIIVPGLVSVQGWSLSPHQCLTEGFRMVAKASRQSDCPPIYQIIPQRTFFSFREWNQSWLTSRCPRAASRQTQTGSSEPLLKMNLLTPFCGGWTAAKSTSALTV